MSDATGPLYVTKPEAIHLHDWVIAKHRGRPGIHDRGALESCLGQPQLQLAYGYECYPSLAEKAAAYAFFFALNNSFTEGNKRTALLVAIHFLRKNGLAHVYDEDAIADTIEAVVEKQAGMDDLVALFRAPPPPLT